MKTLLLLGQAGNDNIQTMIKHCEEKSQAYRVIDTQTFGNNFTVSSSHLSDIVLSFKDSDLCLSAIQSVLWDRIAPPQPINQQENAILNTASCLQVLLTQSQLNWVNSWQAFQFHKTKPSQLLLAKQLGANVPHTYFGNSLSAALSFIAQYKNTIIKPLHGGALTKIVCEETVDNLPQILSQQPMTVQNLIEGEDVRTYIVGRTLFSAKIHSEEIDFRKDPDIKLTPITLPRHIELLAVRIMRAFHMQWTAIDWRLRPDGQFVFLEANPAPRFTEFERVTGYPIARHLFALLTTTI